MSLIGDIAEYAAKLLVDALPAPEAAVAMVGVDVLTAAYRAAGEAGDKDAALTAAKAAMDRATAELIVRRARGG